MQITTIGFDLAKRVFQVHAVDTSGDVDVRKVLRRSQVLPFFTKLPPCLIGIGACGTSHHWARELTKLGREVRMMPPGYVKPYVKRGKNDAVHAEAICEAVTRPTMRFVAMKSAPGTPDRRQGSNPRRAADGDACSRPALRTAHRYPCAFASDRPSDPCPAENR